MTRSQNAGFGDTEWVNKLKNLSATLPSTDRLLLINCVAMFLGSSLNARCCVFKTASCSDATLTWASFRSSRSFAYIWSFASCFTRRSSSARSWLVMRAISAECKFSFSRTKAALMASSVSTTHFRSSEAPNDLSSSSSQIWRKAIKTRSPFLDWTVSHPIEFVLLFK